jgi:formylglycine-generating enzyme required for sulfatase activity
MHMHRLAISTAAALGLAALVPSVLLIGAPAFAKGPTADLKAYTESVAGTAIGFDMVLIPAGRYRMGSPASESGREADEGPQADVTVGAFWMSKYEVTWDEYDQFRKLAPKLSKGADAPADAVTGPTPPYADESWGFGKGRQPAIGMTWHAATEYCRWLSAKTGHHYRLPTEAEWEYAARAGTSTPWSSGEDAASLDASAWHAGNANSTPHRVGGKKPNAFGLYDMHGNVAEWTLDRYDPKRYAALKGPAAKDPVALPGTARYPHVVRGGSFEDDAVHVRSAARRASKPAWSRRDPQEPQSVWWHTDASFVGFRVVRAMDEAPALKQFKSKVTRASPNQ